MTAFLPAHARRLRLPRSRALFPRGATPSCSSPGRGSFRGKLRDPLVGRDHLWGVLAGLAVCLILNLENIPPALFRAPGQTPVPVNPRHSRRPRRPHFLYVARQVVGSFVWLFMIAASLFFGRLDPPEGATRRRRAVATSIFLGFTGTENPLFEMSGAALIASIFLLLLFRWRSSRPLAVGLGRLQPSSLRPRSRPISPSWFTGYGLFCLAIVLAIAVYSASGRRAAAPSSIPAPPSTTDRVAAPLGPSSPRASS